MTTVTSPIAIDSVVGGENTRPDVAVLSTGRIITVFTTTADQVSSLDPFAQSDPPANTADSDIDGVFLSARGVVGAQFEISIDIEPGHISPRYTQNSAQVALTADGGFAVLYNDLSESFSIGTTSFAMRVNQVVRRFDGTTGALQTEQTVMIPHIQLNGPYSVGAGAPSLIGLSDNSVLVGFHTGTPPDALMLDADASSFGLYERSLSASNTKGAFARVNGATAGDQRNLTFALSSGGALVNLFVSSASGTPALMMNVNGAESIVESQFIMGQDTHPRAAFLDADSFVVVYERRFSAYVPGVSDSNNVAFTIMNVNGTVETARVEVTPPDGLGVSVDNPQIAVGRDGTFLVAWDERGTGSSAGTIRGRIYTAAGAPVGAAFDISPIAQAGGGFSLDAMPDGRFFVSWGTFDGHVKGAFVDGRTQGIVFTGTDLGDEAVGTEFVDDMSGGLADDALYGGLGDDTLHGGAGKDRLEGEDGGDLIYGEAGDDVLIGAAGDDALDGGADSDTADYSGAAVAITIDLAIAGQQNTGQGLDTLISIENLIGASLVDTLRGDGAANRLDGGLGRDVMAGRGGDDVYVVDVANELVTEALNEGTDTVESSVTYRLLANFENLVLVGPLAINGTGNELANDIKGNDAANTLVGAGGIDTIHGGADADTLDGGAEGDFLYGEAGNDAFRAGVGADLFDGGADTDVVNYSTGTSTVVYLDGSGANAAAAAGDTLVGIENLVGSLTGVDVFVGDGAANRLTGNGGNDRLTGRAGNDILEGGAGNDRLVGEQGLDAMTGGEDADTFVFNLAPAAGGLDRITDFAGGTDKLEIDASQFGGGLVAGGVVNLVSGSAPTSTGFAGGVFHYDTDDGFLYWDADGQGAGARVSIVRLQNLPTLTTADFTVVA